ncbi:hypothetical protein ABLE92_08640 [Gordonia sp. VNQ95]|uniref:hypothetical protein n=1 Tax=Gordonia sp. VNQ95 TaxID=3156619 RepID=UPI0032B339EE
MATRLHKSDTTGLDELNPADHPARDARHIRRIIAAVENQRAADAELRAAVREAHAAGDSWTVIGAALGVSRQAAFQRFGRD